MTLLETLTEFRHDPNHQIPKDMETTIYRHIDHLKKSKEGKGLNKGAFAPDFPLTIDGKKKTLYQLLQTGPCVLSFYRGSWCSYCNIQLQAYEGILPEIKDLGGHLIAVSLEDKRISSSKTMGPTLSYPTVVDDGHISRNYRLLYDIPENLKKVYESLGVDLNTINSDGAWHLPMTATFIIDHKGLILYKYLDEDFHMRMEPEKILALLNVIT